MMKSGVSRQDTGKEHQDIEWLYLNVPVGTLVFIY